MILHYLAFIGARIRGNIINLVNNNGHVLIGSRAIQFVFVMSLETKRAIWTTDIDFVSKTSYYLKN